MASQVKPNTKPTPYADRPLPPSADLETPDDYKNTFKGRAAISKYADPCQAAAQASYDCLERTHYNRQECMDYFQTYRDCKKKWIEQRRQDRMNGKE